MSDKNGTATIEERMARTLDRLEPVLDQLGDFPKVADRLKVVEGLFEGFKGFDPKAVLEGFDKVRAAQEKLAAKIRGSTRGLYVSGIEDQEFSIARACMGVRLGWDSVKGSGHEREIMRQAAQKAIDDGIYGKASHSAGDDTSAGLFIPDQVIPDVIAAIYARSVFFNLDGDGMTRVSVLEGLFGGEVKIPKFDGGLIAYWIGEEDQYVQSQARVGDVRLKPNKLGVLVRINRDLRDLVAYGFEGLLRQDMIRKAALKVDWTVPRGTGGDMPLGFMRQAGIKYYRAENGTVLDWAGAQAVSDWDGGELDFDGLDDMESALEDDDINPGDGDDWAWIAPPKFFRRLRRIKVENYSSQTTGQPYLLGAPMLPMSRLAEHIGAFDKTTQFPRNALPGASIGGATDSTTQKYGDVVKGDWKQVVVGRWAGIEIDDDEGKGLGYTSDQIYMKLRMRLDVAVRQPRAIIVCPDARMLD